MIYVKLSQKGNLNEIKTEDESFLSILGKVKVNVNLKNNERILSYKINGW